MGRGILFRLKETGLVNYVDAFLFFSTLGYFIFLNKKYIIFENWTLSLLWTLVHFSALWKKITLQFTLEILHLTIVKSCERSTDIHINIVILTYQDPGVSV